MSSAGNRRASFRAARGMRRRIASPAMLIPLDAIRDAAARTAPHLHRTPVLSSRTLGERAGVRLLLKCESFQKTGSFKPRGALNIVLSMPEERRRRGLI